MSNTNDTASKESTRAGRAGNGEGTRARKQHVILDYRGTVGRGTIDKGAIRNNAAQPHRLSPLMAIWPENGQADLQLQPGVNVVPSELWDFYTKKAQSASGDPGHPQVMELVKAKQIRELTELPDDPGGVLDMIARTIDHDGLKWIASQEKAGENRQEILDAVADRLAKARPIKLKPIAFQKAVPLVRDPHAQQPSMAMG